VSAGVGRVGSSGWAGPVSADVGEPRIMSQARDQTKPGALLALSMSARHAIAVVRGQSLAGQTDLARCVSVVSVPRPTN
jgi:hypothetical protein